jgi:methionine-rich copper-binding protein CopC
MNIRRIPAFALSATVGSLPVISGAWAHATLVSASPAANETVESPKTIALHFSETVEPKFSGVVLTKTDGGKVSIKSTVPNDDKKALVGVVGSKIPTGVYRVDWHVVSSDGHRMTGTFNFTVP